jgi:hypothetical protein
MPVTVEDLERQQENLQAIVAKRDLILRLEKNQDFRKLIHEDFIVQDCANYVHESNDPRLTPEQQADALAMAQAAGCLKRYLTICVQMGNRAEQEIKQISATIDEVRSEES